MFKIFKLAVRDYFYEWQISMCHILALASILAPLMILFGLKFGVIGNMISQLVEEPLNRELRPVASKHIAPEWFKKLYNRSDVAFVIPLKRNLAANIQLKSKTAKTILNVELIPTAENDPLLPEISNPPKQIDTIILSKSAANKLSAKAGDLIDGSISRKYKNKTQRVHIQLVVQAVAESQSFNRDGAFCSLALAEALENFRDGHSVPELGWPGEPNKTKHYYTGFRLFARTINEVESLKRWLNKQGIDVRTRAHEIAMVSKLDENLTTVYWVVAFTSIIGYVLSLGASLWANVDRKYKELCILRLTGFRTSEIICFPIIQAMLTACLGWILAVFIFQFVAFAMSHFISELTNATDICRLLPIHYFLAFAITSLAAFCSALLAGFRTIKGEPTDGLREL